MATNEERAKELTDAIDRLIGAYVGVGNGQVSLEYHEKQKRRLQSAFERDIARTALNTGGK